MFGVKEDPSLASPINYQKMTETEKASMRRYEQQIAHALKELNRYLLPASAMMEHSREQAAISVCYDFSRQNKDIRDYDLLEETIFDDKDTFRNKRILVWRKREMASKRYDKIWKIIKEKKMAQVKCRAIKAQTIVNEVKKVKSGENVAREALELPKYGRLTVTIGQGPLGYVLITWKLLELELAENL
jgi:hypothetical protein